MKKEKELLFSVTMNDCDMQTFTVSGAGGQHRDKAKTGVRITHRL
jgi:protein subunit release factor B